MRIAAGLERGVVFSLMGLMLVVVVLSTVELVLLIVKEILDPRKGLLFLEVSELLGLFSFFFLILIGIELLATIKMYVDQHVIHVEFVLLVALIAVARKVIVLDLNAYPPLSIIGLGVITLSLGGAYALVRGKRVRDEATEPGVGA